LSHSVKNKLYLKWLKFLVKNSFTALNEWLVLGFYQRSPGGDWIHVKFFYKEMFVNQKELVTYIKISVTKHTVDRELVSGKYAFLKHQKR